MKKEVTRLVPKYFDEFQCIGSLCEDTCCAGWSITIDKKTFKNYKKEKNNELKNLLKDNIKINKDNTSLSAYGHFKMDENNRCSMLSDEGLCNIQLLAGEKALCNTCATYPRIVTSINNRIEKALAPSCPEAARLILLKKEGIDFIEDINVEDFSNIEQITYSESQHAAFWKIRVFLISTLQNRQHSIEIRLLVIALCLQSLHQLKDITLLQINATIDKYIAYSNGTNVAQDFSAIDKLYLDQIKVIKQVSSLSGTPQYNVLKESILNSLRLDSPSIINTIKEDYSYYDEVFISKYEYILENYLVNEVYSTIHFANFESILKAFALICIHFSNLRLYLVGLIKMDKNISENDVVYCIQQYSKNVKHSNSISKYISSNIQEDVDTIILKIISMVNK